MRYAYFPGCSASSTGLPYTMSMEYMARQIGLELVEIDDWCCCGTSAARITDSDLGRALPARSLALSELQNPGLDVVAPCAGCYANLKAAVHFARENEENCTHLSGLIELPYEARADVKSLLEIMVQPEMIDAIASKAAASLGGMKLACYYGCAFVRPADVCEFDDPENPSSMERLLQAVGAECIDWSYKTECCGASNQIAVPRQSRGLIARIFENAVANGGEAIVTACPLCWLNLDLREAEINKQEGTSYHIPVYYVTELLALALGATSSESGLDKHFEPAVQYARDKVVTLSEAPSSAEEVSA